MNISRLRATRSHVRHRSRMAIEFLEDRLLLTFDPTPIEQAYMESLNRARLNPQGELGIIFSSLNPLVARDPQVDGAIRYFGVNSAMLQQQISELVPAPPLAWNELLTQAAAEHNRVMQQHDKQEHQLPGEPSLGDRVRAVGYNFRKVTENIYAFAENVMHGHAGFFVDWGEGPGGIQSPAGHRVNIMDPDVIEVGIHVLTDTNPLNAVGPYLVTQDFGNPRDRGNPYIVGVAWRDTNSNGIYDPGEGIKDVEIVVTNGNTTYRTTTMTAGGYQVRVPSGTYQVNAVGGSLPYELVTSNVVVSGHNVKVDFNERTSSRPPIAIADVVTIDALVPVSINVLANDSVPNGTLDKTSVTVTQLPNYGTVQVNSTTGVVTYTMGAARPTSDSFWYTVRDTSGAVSNAAKVTVQLSNGANMAPVAGSFTVSGFKDQTISIPYEAHVSDAENSLDWSTIAIANGPANGTVSINLQTRSFQYRPLSGFVGSDQFAYRIADSLGLYSAPGTVSVNVLSANDPPVARDDQFVTSAARERVIDVLANDEDNNHDRNELSVFIAVQPQHGRVVGQGRDLRYIPDAGFFGMDTLRYQAVDPAAAASSLATVRIYVTQSGRDWRNPVNALDVDGNDQVTPLDALLVINQLGVNFTTGPIPPSLAGGPTPFVDVNGDNVVSPIDALMVINGLRSTSPSASASQVVTSDDETDRVLENQDVLAIAAMTTTSGSAPRSSAMEDRWCDAEFGRQKDTAVTRSDPVAEVIPPLLTSRFRLLSATSLPNGHSARMSPTLIDAMFADWSGGLV